MRTRDEEAVFVEASARLHFGVLDLRGTLGRWFGGIGASASTPTLLVSAARADYLITGNKRHFPAYWKSTTIISAREFVTLAAPHLFY